MDSSKPVMTYRDGSELPRLAKSMTELDIARVRAAYGCSDGPGAGPCQRHVKLSKRRPELSLTHNDLSLRDCEILVSARKGYRVVMEPRAWDWEVCDFLSSNDSTINGLR